MLSAERKWSLSYEPSKDKKYHLLEVNDAELQRVLDDGDELAFKGGEDDSLTLCTAKSTFQVQQLCISNSQLLCIQQDEVLRMVSSSSYRLEPKLVRPNFKKLQDLLDETLLDVPDKAEDTRLIRYSDVFSSVAASDAEIEKFLKKQGVVNFDGHARKISPRLLGRFFEVLMMNAALNEKSVIKCEREVCEQLMSESDEFTPQLSHHILQMYSTDPGLLDTKAVCQMYARQILSVQSKMPVREFEQLWNDVCRDFEPELSMLSGIAILEGTPACVCLFDAASLSADIETRFNAVFMKRAKWSWDELKAYIRPLLDNPTDEKSCEALMVKYCRISTSGEEKMATSKIPLQPF